METILDKPPEELYTPYNLTTGQVNIHAVCLMLNYLSFSFQESFKFYADKLKEKVDKARTQAEE